MRVCRLDLEVHSYVRKELKYYLILMWSLLAMSLVALILYTFLIESVEGRMKMIFTLVVFSLITISFVYAIGVRDTYNSFKYIVCDPELSEIMIKKIVSYDIDKDRISGEGFVFDFSDSKLYMHGKVNLLASQKVNSYLRVLRMYAIDWSR